LALLVEDRVRVNVESVVEIQACFLEHCDRDDTIAVRGRIKKQASMLALIDPVARARSVASGK